MSHLSKPPTGLVTPREAAFQLERTLSGCRTVAATSGFQFLVYLLNMSVEEARAQSHASTPTLMSDKNACLYVAEALGQLKALVQRPRLRTLAIMIDHAQSEAKLMAKGECGAS